MTNTSDRSLMPTVTSDWILTQIEQFIMYHHQHHHQQSSSPSISSISSIINHQSSVINHHHHHHHHEAYPKRTGVQHHHTHIPPSSSQITIKLETIQSSMLTRRDDWRRKSGNLNRKKQLLFFFHLSHYPQAFGRWCPNSSTCVMAEDCHTQASGRGRFRRMSFLLVSYKSCCTSRMSEVVNAYICI